MLLNHRGEVLVGRRIDTPGQAWQMPQGGIDAGETPRRAVTRELVEEIGTDKAEIVAESAQWLRYDLPRDLAARMWKGRYRGQEQKWFALRFTGVDGDIDLKASHHPEFSQWKMGGDRTSARTHRGIQTPPLRRHCGRVPPLGGAQGWPLERFPFALPWWEGLGRASAPGAIESAIDSIDSVA